MTTVTVPIVTIPFPELFFHFSKWDDAKSDGKTMPLSQSDKWMKQAGLFDKKITMTDTGICFNKFKVRALNLKDYEKFITDLAKYKNVDLAEIQHKMTTCGMPGVEPNVPIEPKRKF